MEHTDSDLTTQDIEQAAPNLLYALNEVATDLQQSIQREQNIFTVFQNRVVALGLRGGISLLDEHGESLTFKTIAFTNPLRQILRIFEDKVEHQAEGYKIEIDRVDVYQKVIRERRTEFVKDTSSVATQVIPSQIRSVISPLLSFLGKPPGIFTPLIFDGEVKGMLNIVGTNLNERDVPAVRAFSNQIAVALENVQLVKKLKSAKAELETAYQATLEGWVQALDLRDQETEGHTLRVAETTVRLAQSMGLPADDLPHVRRGALLHDVGKMAIPDNILRKSGPLSEDEWTVMKKHPAIAYDWLSKIEYLKPALDIPRFHHERWDGSGYPYGLRGDDIPISARIFAVVDVWDAMTFDRPYRKRLGKDQAAQWLSDQSDVLFDRQVVECFAELGDS